MVDKRHILLVARKLIQAGYTNLAQEVVSLVFDEDEVDASVSVQHIQSVAKEILDRFFKEYDLPVPEIKIKDNLGAKWLGRQICRQTTEPGERSLIELQKSILDDDKTLRRVLTHELIHHYQCFHAFDLFETDFKGFLEYDRSLKRNAHGGDFKEIANKINSVLGDNFVSEKSDEDDVLSTPRNFYVIITPYKKEYMYAWFQRLSSKRDLVDAYKKQEKAKVFETNNRRFTKGFILSKACKWSVPKDQPTKDLLKDLYENGKEASL